MYSVLRTCPAERSFLLSSHFSHFCPARSSPSADDFLPRSFLVVFISIVLLPRGRLFFPCNLLSLSLTSWHLPSVASQHLTSPIAVLRYRNPALRYPTTLFSASAAALDWLTTGPPLPCALRNTEHPTAALSTPRYPPRYATAVPSLRSFLPPQNAVLSAPFAPSFPPPPRPSGSRAALRAPSFQPTRPARQQIGALPSVALPRLATINHQSPPASTATVSTLLRRK